MGEPPIKGVRKTFIIFYNIKSILVQLVVVRRHHQGLPEVRRRVRVPLQVQKHAPLQEQRLC